MKISARIRRQARQLCRGRNLEELQPSRDGESGGALSSTPAINIGLNGNEERKNENAGVNSGRQQKILA